MADKVSFLVLVWYTFGAVEVVWHVAGLTADSLSSTFQSTLVVVNFKSGDGPLFNPPYPAATWIPYLELVVALIKSLAWPAAAALAVYLFRPEIAGLIKRVIKFGPAGMEALPPTQTGASVQEVAIKGGAQRGTDFNDDPVYRGILEAVEAYASTVQEADREAALIKTLAFERMEKAFAIVYADIFGSQIRALSVIINQRHGSITKSEAELEFSELKKVAPALAGWSLEQYLRYLVVARFIEVSDDRIVATMAARNFLVFLQRYNLTFNRPN